MTTELETIISGQGAFAPAPETRTEPQPETTTQQPQAAQEPSSESDPQADDRGNVPLAALQAEREKGRKRYTDAVTDFEKKLTEADQRWQQRFDQLVGNVVRPQQPQAAPVEAPDIWSDPDAYLRQGMQQAISPVLDQLRATQRGMAEVMFREQPGLVAEAEKAFNAAAAAGDIDAAEHARINSSPNPWAAAVQWHQRKQTMTEIGSDPAAWVAQQREALKAELMAEFQQAQQPAAQRAPVATPGNFATGRNVGSRSGPAYAGPSPIDEILGSRR
jgi:hypothetical protein